MGFTIQQIRKPELGMFSNRFANVFIVTTFSNTLRKSLTLPHVSSSMNGSMAHSAQSEKGSAKRSAKRSAFWAKCGFRIQFMVQ